MATTKLPTDYRFIVMERDKFSGILSKNPFVIDSKITISPYTYHVKSMKHLEFKLFTKNGILTIKHNDIILKDQTKVREFLLSVGFYNIREFLLCFFNSPVIVDTVAIVTLWYVAFEINNYF